MDDEGNEHGSEPAGEEEEEEVMEGEGDDFDHSSDQVEDIVGEIDDMGEFIEPGDGEEIHKYTLLFLFVGWCHQFDS